MDSSYRKTSTQQLPALGTQTKKKGLKKLSLRPDTRVPKSLDFNLEGGGTDPLASDNMGLFKQR